MKLQILLRAVLFLILGSCSLAYTQDFYSFETAEPPKHKDTVQLTIDSSFVEEYSPAELKNKISLYTKLQCAGIGILLGGVGSMLYGFSSATKEAEEEDMITYSSLGYIGVGFEAIIGGIIMSAVMSRNVNEFKSRLKRVSFNIDRRHQFTGFKMSCNF